MLPAGRRKGTSWARAGKNKRPSLKNSRGAARPCHWHGWCLALRGARGQPLSSEWAWPRLGQAAGSPRAFCQKPQGFIPQRSQRIYYPQRALGGSRRGVSFLPNREARPSYKNQLIFHTSARDTVFCFPSGIRCMSYPNRNALASWDFFPLLFFLLWSHKSKLVCRVEGRGERGSHSRFIREDFGIWDNMTQTKILKHRKKLETCPTQEEHKNNKSKGKIIFLNTNQRQRYGQKDLYIFLQMVL